MSSHACQPALPGLVPHASQQLATVVDSRQVAAQTWVTRLRCPELASTIRPGQFFMIRPATGSDPLLGRPFALFDIYRSDGEATELDFGYAVVGKLTALMTAWKPGDEVCVWGPLGNGFPQPTEGHLMCVAGGIGQTPFVPVLRQATGTETYGQDPGRSVRPRRITMCYGVRSREFLAGVDRFEQTGVDLRLATDDGSLGHHGFVTDLLQAAIDSPDPPNQVFCCGPEPMMHRVGDLCNTAGIDCRLSLETPMACGFGACFSCVTRVRISDDDWDYKRTCVEGPVFRSTELLW
jgi:dihydroorotate dehydrogenase electron transfer subunit